MDLPEDLTKKATTATRMEQAVVRFSGDSGDGMQLTGLQFAETVALSGNDASTFPDYPSEIRAPAGTAAGISGFQVHFGSTGIYTPGDAFDVLVAMNAAALRVDLSRLKKGGILIADVSGFDGRNLSLAGYPGGAHPLEDGTLSGYVVYPIDITGLTRECLASSGLGIKEIDRCKNMFLLGLLFWIFEKPPDHALRFIRHKFSGKPVLADANVTALCAGWNYGDRNDTFVTRITVPAAHLPAGNYRNITGNQATAIGLMAAAEKSGLPLLLSSYPITPATDILHELSKYKANGVKTFQAEDEIAAICAAIGAAYAGHIAVTSTSGPGMSLKTEALGFACMAELPLVVIDVQRGGPSTGLPTKTEQSDLLMALHGRHGEAPLPVLGAASPSDCFETVYEACRIAIEHMTPVIVLADGYVANGSQPWKYPGEDELVPIQVNFLKKPNGPMGEVLPYRRDKNGVRPWIKAGTRGLEHRIGGLEKENETGKVSYDPVNHERMVALRAEKIRHIQQFIPPAKIEQGPERGKLLLLGWGSTYGAIRTAVRECIQEGFEVSQLHLRHLNPFPSNLGSLLFGFEKILVPEMNAGHLLQLVRGEFLIPATGFSKIQGLPFTTAEIKAKIIRMS